LGNLQKRIGIDKISRPSTQESASYSLFIASLLAKRHHQTEHLVFVVALEQER